MSQKFFNISAAVTIFTEVPSSTPEKKISTHLGLKDALDNIEAIIAYQL